MANFLIVDDANIMRIRLKRVLEALGHNVIAEAETAYDAIVEYKKHKNNLDIITMDITMPMKNKLKDGIVAVREIIKMDKDMKIIMITSHGEEEKVIEAIRAGAIHYILKPFQQATVEKVLKKIGL
jgi:two-component system chemotaxis response regulator CheY